MGYIQGRARGQLELVSATLDDVVAKDNPVRVIDAFVGQLDLEELKFERTRAKSTGRPGYDPADLLKLYVYGYLNQIRVTRRLELECKRNLEVQWLLNELRPDFKTIAEFRRANAKAIVQVCSAFMRFCRAQQLIGGHTVAIDGTKFAASNSRSRYHTQKSVQEQQHKLQRRIEHYLKQLEVSEQQPQGEQEQGLNAEQVGKALEALAKKAQALGELHKRVEQNGGEPLAESDPDARLMPVGVEGSMVGYNLQSAVDAKHKLIVSFEISQSASDRQQLLCMAQAAKQAVHAEQLEVLVDGGYSNGEQAAACEQQGIEVTAPNPDAKNNPNKGMFLKQQFSYDPHSDTYRCPAGKLLRRERGEGAGSERLYRASECSGCPLKVKCTRVPYRTITRNANQEVLDRMHGRAKAHPEKLRQRAGLAEHPFAWLKWATNGGRFVTRGLERVRAEAALAVLGFNLRRCLNILGVPKMLEQLT